MLIAHPLRTNYTSNTRDTHIHTPTTHCTHSAPCTPIAQPELTHCTSIAHPLHPCYTRDTHAPPPRTAHTQLPARTLHAHCTLMTHVTHVTHTHSHTPTTLCTHTAPHTPTSHPLHTHDTCDTCDTHTHTLPARSAHTQLPAHPLHTHDTRDTHTHTPSTHCTHSAPCTPIAHPQGT